MVKARPEFWFYKSYFVLETEVKVTKKGLIGTLSLSLSLSLSQIVHKWKHNVGSNIFPQRFWLSVIIRGIIKRKTREFLL